MKTPTDPKEIHRRAEIIRLKLDQARKEAKERAKLDDQIKKDLDLIEFDRRIKAAQPSKFFF